MNSVMISAEASEFVIIVQPFALHFVEPVPVVRCVKAPDTGYFFPCAAYAVRCTYAKQRSYGDYRYYCYYNR